LDDDNSGGLYINLFKKRFSCIYKKKKKNLGIDFDEFFKLATAKVSNKDSKADI
jgi:DNA polymerase sigma